MPLNLEAILSLKRLPISLLCQAQRVGMNKLSLSVGSVYGKKAGNLAKLSGKQDR
jgi:hypothetical protein